MLSKAHFDGMLECSWEHAINMSEQLANGDGEILFYCKLYKYIEDFALRNCGDVDAEPYFYARQFCIDQLREYYDKNA